MSREPFAATAEQRRAAASLFERASQVPATGDLRHAVGLLQECCRLDPANLIYRQALRRAAKARYRHNSRGRWFAWFFNWPLRLQLIRSIAGARHLDVMGIAERILANNPWDVAAHRSLARAADAVGLLDVATWALEQARQSRPDDTRINRELARFYERRGHYTQALGLWERLQRCLPRDAEAATRQAQISRLISARHTLPFDAKDTITQPEALAPVNRGVDSPRSPSLPGRLHTPLADSPVEREAQHLQQAIADDPTAPTPRLALARLYRQAGCFDAAQEALTTGLGPTGHDFALSVELADLAIEPFRRHLAIVRDKRRQRDDEDLRRLDAELVREINSRELELVRIQADRQPGRSDLRYELAVRLLRCQRSEEALRVFLTADHGWLSSRGAGYCYRLWGNVRQALGHFEEALSSLPAEETNTRHELLYESACCYAELGEYERAVERGAELAEAVPNYREILTLLPTWQTHARPAS
ncbi:MAG: hypothetical protein EBV06_12560 [Planctomycetia bacterium]|nr:hypothetical protein [Planctomycetia bacterium]